MNAPAYALPQGLYASRAEALSGSEIYLSINPAMLISSLRRISWQRTQIVLGVEVRSRTRSRLNFLIIPRQRLSWPPETKITFETHHPDARRITVPVILQEWMKGR